MSDGVAQDQIRAFVERILRLKEEAKSINGDIREVYAEAKGNGFDKTVLGKLVSYIEKRATDSAAQMEAEALFDLYLSAYDGASASHTHAYAREDDETAGELVAHGMEAADHGTVATDGAAAPLATNPGGDDVAPPPAHAPEQPGTDHGSVSTPDEGGADSSQIIEPQPGLRADNAAQTVQPHPAVATSETLTESVESSVGGSGDSNTAPAPITEPVTLPPPSVIAAGDDRSAESSSPAATVVVPLRSHNPNTHFLNSKGLPRLHGCLKPEACGGNWRAKCTSCQRAEGLTQQDGAA